MEFFFNPETGRVEQRSMNNNNIGISSMFDQVYSDPFNINRRDSEIIIGADGKAKTIPILPMSSGEIMAGSIVPPDFNAERFQSIFPTTGIMQQAPLQNLGIDTSYGVANEEDVEQVDSLTGEKKSGGILDLIMSIAIPGYGFLKNIGKGGFEGIRGLNQRLQQSDFGQSDNFAEFLKRKRDRKALARDPNVFRDARNITSNLKRTDADDVIDRGRGDRPGGGGVNYSAPSKPQRSFSSDYSEAQKARKF